MAVVHAGSALHKAPSWIHHVRHTPTVASPIKTLTDLAMASYDAALNCARQPDMPWVSTGDVVLDNIVWRGFAQSIESELDEATGILRAEPALAPLISEGEESGMMIMRAGGGASESFRNLVYSLLLCASRQLYILRSDFNEAAYVGSVLENYEELKRAARGEQVRAYRITGFSGIKLAENARVETPWGALYRAPDNAGPFAPFMHNIPVTTVILAQPQLQSLVISRDPDPQAPLADEEQLRQALRVRQLLPLAFALVTVHSNLCAPLPTFELVMFPFGTGVGWSNTPWFFPVNISPVEPTAGQLVEVEVWSRRLDQHYVENLAVTGRRIVSAIAQRADVTDSLVDAVTAWESMVGTGTETSFRVTAALSRLLERDPKKRLAFRKELGDIYSYRSRAVHGDPLDPANVTSRSARAIEIGLKALAEIYSRSEDWLTAKSNERADRLILEE